MRALPDMSILSRRKLGGVALMALLYVLGGALGLQLAVPPGYATIIWPASGIATVGLLLYGRALWPGVFLGSLVLNAVVSGGIHQSSPDLLAMTVAGFVAVGSTLQALLAATLVRRLFGIPVQLSGLKDLMLFGAIGGPLACLVAASVGVATLYVSGVLSADALFGNWLTWWLGDILGVLIFVPIGLLNPWRPWSVRWSGGPVAGFTMVAMLSLIVPLGVTFYAWKLTSEITFERNHAAFETLAEDSAHALRDRLESYKRSLDGGAGLFAASETVSLDEWRTYVDELDIERTLPGINGIGYIEPIGLGDVASFEARMQLEGVPEFAVHPDTPSPDVFAITFIEPLAPNRKALGLNIAFEDNRRNGAAAARDTGKATITKRIFLVQDSTRSAGFLLLRPLYRNGARLDSVAARRQAFRGWIYAPFISNRFLGELTSSQGTNLHLTVYDGEVADGDQLIFSSKAGDSTAAPAAYKITKVISAMEQRWTVVWESTPAFEASVTRGEPLLVLLGGIVLSALFGALQISYLRREASIRRTVALKTREIAAREHENRSIVDTAVVAIILLDRNGEVRSANRATELIFGFPADEVVGGPIARLLDGFDASSLAQFHKRGEQEPETDRLPNLVEARRKDGAELFLDVQLNDWFTEAGELRYTAIIRDVTVQRRVTLALEEAEKRWNFALEGASIGVFDIDLTRGTSFVSDTWKSMLGFDRREEIDAQREWLSRIHPDDIATVKAADDACMEGWAPRSQSEYRIRREDGQWIWLRSDAIVIERASDGTALRMIGTQTEITELKSAEAAMRASEEKLRSAIEHAPVGMALVDLDGRWFRVNEALCKLLGYSEDQLRQLDFQSITHPDDLETDLVLVDQLLSGDIQTYQLEKRYIHKDGHSVWGQLSVSLPKDAEGKPEYFISQIQDISDRKEMDRVKTEFIATVSHELRTPLTSIRGSLGLVVGAMSKDLPTNVLRLLTIAHKNCERLIFLINDILDLEKIADGSMHIERKAEELGSLVAQAIEANEAYAEQFDVSLEFERPKAEFFVDVDQARFQQVLSNLLSNAAKFSPRSGKVDVRIEVLGETVRVSVVDHGTGILPEFRSRIFSRFSQADGSATREKGGTGLGLHISKQLIEKMGGTIGFDSQAGEGSTFWIELHALDMRSHADVLAIENSALTDATRNLPKALHIEDNKDFSEVLAASLKDRVMLINASTCASARQRLDDQEFDLVIIDLELPDGDGLGLLDHERLADTGVPVIVLSASDLSKKDPRIRQSLVKSRTPDDQIVDTILMIAEGGKDPEVVHYGGARA